MKTVAVKSRQLGTFGSSCIPSPLHKARFDCWRPSRTREDSPGPSPFPSAWRGLCKVASYPPTHCLNSDNNKRTANVPSGIRIDRIRSNPIVSDRNSKWQLNVMNDLNPLKTHPRNTTLSGVDVFRYIYILVFHSASVSIVDLVSNPLGNIASRRF